MAEKQITRRDVAARAGVSETIVSYVLNNNRYVAQDKRERVLHAVQELHYQPNSIARALKGKQPAHAVSKNSIRPCMGCWAHLLKQIAAHGLHASEQRFAAAAALAR